MENTVALISEKNDFEPLKKNIEESFFLEFLFDYSIKQDRINLNKVSSILNQITIICLQ